MSTSQRCTAEYVASCTPCQVAAAGGAAQPGISAPRANVGRGVGCGVWGQDWHGGRPARRPGLGNGCRVVPAAGCLPWLARSSERGRWCSRSRLLSGEWGVGSGEWGGVARGRGAAGCSQGRQPCSSWQGAAAAAAAATGAAGQHVGGNPCSPSSTSSARTHLAVPAINLRLEEQLCAAEALVGHGHHLHPGGGSTVRGGRGRRQGRRCRDAAAAQPTQHSGAAADDVARAPPAKPLLVTSARVELPACAGGRAPSSGAACSATSRPASSTHLLSHKPPPPLTSPSRGPPAHQAARTCA
jgi:hypothetical protein